MPEETRMLYVRELAIPTFICAPPTTYTVLLAKTLVAYPFRTPAEVKLRSPNLNSPMHSDD